MSNRVQGGADVGRSQDGDRRDLEQEESGGTQVTAMKVTHGGADAGRSHGGGSAQLPTLSPGQTSYEALALGRSSALSLSLAQARS